MVRDIQENRFLSETCKHPTTGDVIRRVDLFNELHFSSVSGNYSARMPFDYIAGFAFLCLGVFSSLAVHRGGFFGMLGSLSAAFVSFAGYKLKRWWDRRSGSRALDFAIRGAGIPSNESKCMHCKMNDVRGWRRCLICSKNKQRCANCGLTKRGCMCHLHGNDFVVAERVSKCSTCSYGSVKLRKPLYMDSVDVLPKPKDVASESSFTYSHLGTGQSRNMGPVGYGKLFSANLPLVIEQSKKQLLYGLFYRALAGVTAVDGDVFAAFESFATIFRSVCIDQVATAQQNYFVRMTHDEWIAHFKGGLRAIYQKAWDNVRLRGWTMSKKQLAKVTAFQKHEMLTDKARPIGRTPVRVNSRIIQCYSKEVNCYMGPDVQSIYHWLKHIWGNTTSMFFACGSNNLSVGRFFEFWKDHKDWTFAEDDFTLYDSTQQIGLFKVFRKLFDKEFTWYAKMAHEAQEETIGQTSYKDLYSIPGTMKSGAPYTTLQNSVINMMTHLFVFSAISHMDLKTLLDHVRIAVCGDDCVILMSPTLRQSITVDAVECLMTKLGLQCKFKFTTFKDVTFLSCQPWPVSFHGRSVITMCPRLSRGLAKFGFSLLEQECPRQWWSVTLAGHKVAYSGVPFLGAWVKRLSESYPTTQVPQDRSAVHTGFEVEPDDEGIALFKERYPAAYDHRADLESISNDMFEIVDVPFFNHIFVAENFCISAD